jgi:hypothetical protein
VIRAGDENLALVAAAHHVEIHIKGDAILRHRRLTKNAFAPCSPRSSNAANRIVPERRLLTERGQLEDDGDARSSSSAPG